MHVLWCKGRVHDATDLLEDKGYVIAVWHLNEEIIKWSTDITVLEFASVNAEIQGAGVWKKPAAAVKPVCCGKPSLKKRPAASSDVSLPIQLRALIAEVAKHQNDNPIDNDSRKNMFSRVYVKLKPWVVAHDGGKGMLSAAVRECMDLITG